MYIKQLHYFVTLADTGSFTKAAAIHYIVQTSMSQQISSLEKELGIQLFTRTTRKVELTAAGKAFYDEIKPLVIKLDDAINMAKRINMDFVSEFVLGIDEEINTQPFVDALKVFSLQFPVTNIKIMVDKADRLFETLNTNNCDIVIANTRNKVHEKSIISTPLWNEQVSARSVVFSENTCSPELDKIKWQDIEKKTVLLYSPMPDPIRDYKETELINGMLSTPLKVVSNLESLRIMVSAGLGVGIIPRQMEHRIGSGVQILPLEDKFVRWEAVAAYRFSGNNKKEISCFLESLIDSRSNHPVP